MNRFSKFIFIYKPFRNFYKFIVSQCLKYITTLNQVVDFGAGIGTFMSTVGNVNNSPKGFVRIANRIDSLQFLLFQINSVTLDPEYNEYILGVTNQSSSTTSPFQNTEDIIVSFVTNVKMYISKCNYEIEDDSVRVKNGVSIDKNGEKITPKKLGYYHSF